MNASRVRFQICAELAPTAGSSPADHLGQAVDLTLAWLAEQLGAPLPAEAHAGQSFLTEQPGRIVRAVALPERGLWTARLIRVENAAPPTERGAPDAATVARRWTHDVAFALASDRVQVGMRVTCAMPPGAPDDSDPARPRLVLDLAGRFDLREVRRIETVPWTLASEADLDELHALLVDPRRRLPVLVLTKPAPGSLGVPTEEYLLDARGLAEQVAGMAYVVLMPPPASFAWSARLGKRWSAYLGAVRTYRPGLDFAADDPTDHPLALAERVMRTEYRGQQAEPAYAQMLIDQVTQHAATRRVDWGALRFLEDATILGAELARERATTPSSQVERSADEVAALHAKIDRLEEEREVALSLAAGAEGARDRAQVEAVRLRAQLDALRAEFVTRTGTSPDAGVELPATYDDLPEWVETHLAGRLALHPRALRGLREAAYEDVGLVARALLLLADAYRNQKLGHPGAHRVFEAGTQDLGLRIGKSIARHRAGEEGATYFVRWPAGGGGGEEFLEWHLRKGSGKDARHCLAVYFFWDEAGQQVVVGWLPGHLENRMT